MSGARSGAIMKSATPTGSLTMKSIIVSMDIAPSKTAQDLDILVSAKRFMTLKHLIGGPLHVNIICAEDVEKEGI
jgi:hypothetical protein